MRTRYFWFCVRNKFKMKVTTDPKMNAEDPNTTSMNLSPSMSRLRIYKNLIVLCLGFFFLFCAYQALANLQSTINMEANVGLISQSIIYAALIVSSLFLPKLVIRKFGCKRTLFLCILTYIPYIAANFYPTMTTFAPTSVLIGLGAAPLWSAKCTYINEISAMYSDVSSNSADIVTSRFFGIFFMVFQNTQIWGNLVSFFVLKPSESLTPLVHSNETASMSDAVECGAKFCTGTNENLMPPTEHKRYTLIGIFVVLAFLAAAIVALFLDPLPRKEKEDHESLLSKAAATLRHLKKTDQMLLVPLTVFSGMEQAFILGDFSKAYVACAWGIHHVGLVFICFGIVDSIMSYFAGRLVKYVSRMALMYAGAAGNIAVCVVLFVWQPTSDQFVVFFVLAGVWGLSDAIWQTQLNALYGVLFRSEEEAAFSNYRLWESFGFCLAFAYSTFLCVVPKIAIVVAFTCLGIFCYTLVEIRNRKVETKPEKSDEIHL